MKINNVCIIGLGYVGLTLAVTLAESGFKVFGVEKNKEVLKALLKGKPHFHEKGLSELLIKQNKNNLKLFSEIPDENIDCFIIAVSTPIDKKTKKPQMDYIIKATKEIVPHLTCGQLIIMRSTLPVGTTRNVVMPILQEKCKNFYLSFCPERTAEGKALEELKTLPQIVGGLNEESADYSVELFSKISPLVIRMTSLEAAEIAKLVNNSYRDMIFAYANQIALICKELGLNAAEVIETANLGYPRSNVQKPGLVGGLCLEKDPYILMDSAKCDCPLIKAAKDLNRNMVGHIFERVISHLKSKKVNLDVAKIFISGFAFKGNPETDDLRDSSAINLLELFRKNKFKNIYGHDFVVPKNGFKGIKAKYCSIEKGFAGADAVIFMNNHESYKKLDINSLVKTLKKGALIFDSWQLFSDELLTDKNINYESIGFKK